MTLLPEPFRKGWVAICAYSTGAGLHVRRTLEVGDIIRPCAAPARSISCQPPVDEDALTRLRADTEIADRHWLRANTLMVGKDISVADLYPNLWDDWRWA